MAFDWSKTGNGPDRDEFEISVVGPGFGECIMIHIGAGRWIIVDSCVDPSDKGNPVPVAERYLRHLGVALDREVDLIVATHWHDDHVRGLSRLIESCPGAKFSCANALLKTEFVAYVKSMQTGSAATNGAKVKEFSRSISLVSERGTPVRYASGSRSLMSWSAELLGRANPCEVKSLSPSDREFELFLQHIAQEMPQHGLAKRAAARQDPNLSSVVLHIDAGEFSVLLGADMEVHHDPLRGWGSVLTEAGTSQVQRSGFFKVAHHGSVNGHHEAVWATLLHERPICVVTPFNRLPELRKLPTDADLERLRGLGRTFVTAPRVGKRSGARDPAVVRSLKEQDIVTRDLSTEVGMVRFRRSLTETAWRAEVFAPALELAAA